MATKKVEQTVEEKLTEENNALRTACNTARMERNQFENWWRKDLADLKDAQKTIGILEGERSFAVQSGLEAQRERDDMMRRLAFAEGFIAAQPGSEQYHKATQPQSATMTNAGFEWDSYRLEVASQFEEWLMRPADEEAQAIRDAGPGGIIGGEEIDLGGVAGLWDALDEAPKQS